MSVNNTHTDLVPYSNISSRGGGSSRIRVLIWLTNTNPSPQSTPSPTINHTHCKQMRTKYNTNSGTPAHTPQNFCTFCRHLGGLRKCGSQTSQDCPSSSRAASGGSPSASRRWCALEIGITEGAHCIQAVPRQVVEHSPTAHGGILLLQVQVDTLGKWARPSPAHQRLSSIRRVRRQAHGHATRGIFAPAHKELCNRLPSRFDTDFVVRSTQLTSPTFGILARDLTLGGTIRLCTNQQPSSILRD